MLKFKLILIILVSFPQLLIADSCETSDAKGIDILQIEEKYSKELAGNKYLDMYSRAEILGSSLDNTDKIAALLLLHKIQEGSKNADELASSLILLSKQRALVVQMLQYWPHYKCHEFKAARDYVNRYPLGYRGAEIWGSWIYVPNDFIDTSIKGYAKENQLKVKYLAYQEVDPCNPYQYDNSCYAATFSKIADDSTNTQFWHEALFTAAIFNLDLSVCEFATSKERELGLREAQRHIQTLKENFPKSKQFREAMKQMSLHEINNYQRKGKFSITCRYHNDN